MFDRARLDTRDGPAGHYQRVTRYHLSLVGMIPEVRTIEQHHIQQRIMDLHGSVVFDEPELAELVHEHTHSRPRGPDHLREGLLAYLRYDRLGLTLLAEVRHQEE